MISNWLDDWEFLRVLDARRNSPIIAEAADRLERLLKQVEQNPPSESEESDDAEEDKLPSVCPTCEAVLREENV